VKLVAGYQFPVTGFRERVTSQVGFHREFVRRNGMQFDAFEQDRVDAALAAGSPDHWKRL